ncbi:hypothetical protein DK419_19890 [Methylobacterium terrae]|uniref:Uncharacterized protein n=1 Tax=Methylobacterium terrae TaxID=2202827 RepID=A0A2U8WS92_9HYPH|nr:protealysin inhibitor emfourin [Methylobacterium terrae]AWN48331.1 hypothetical protein DK419_19890 [Methylobacterium terrae]
MDMLTIERLGGLAGIGQPGSRIRSQGEQPLNALSADDRASVEALFRKPPSRRQAAPMMRDGFRYRITRSGEAGRQQTIEVPEAAVPPALRACVTDSLT